MKRRGGSIVLQIHRWAGLGTVSDLFLTEYRIGFVSVAVCKFCLNDRVSHFVAEYRALKSAVLKKSASDRDGGFS